MRCAVLTLRVYESLWLDRVSFVLWSGSDAVRGMVVECGRAKWCESGPFVDQYDDLAGTGGTSLLDTPVLSC